MLDGKSRLTINAGIIVKSVNNSFWALNVNDGNQYRLNFTSYKMLEMLDGKRTIQDIVDSIHEIFDENAESLFDDSIVFYTNCINQGIVVYAEENENHR